MSNAPSAESANSYGAELRRRSPVLAVIGRADDAVYAVERVLVTMAMFVMTAAVCVNVLYQFLSKQRALINRLQTDASWLDLWGVVVVVVAVFVVARAVWSRTPACRGNEPVVWVLSVATLVAFLAFCGALLWVPSRLAVACMLLAIGAWVAMAELDRPRPLADDKSVDGATKLRVAVVGVVTLGLVIAAATFIPPHYSWTTKLALFLLLWTAFIGASMAAHDGRHLAIDAVRKAIAKRRALPYYEAVSHFIAAVFTAGFTYLAFLYFQDRLVETSAPNEIPDWLKVLAIPFSLALVTLRFGARSIGNVLAIAWGISTAEEPAE